MNIPVVIVIQLLNRRCNCDLRLNLYFCSSHHLHSRCIIDSTLKSEGLFLGLQSNLHLRRATSPQQAHLYNTFFGGQFIHCLYNGHRYVRELKQRRWRRQRQQQKNQQVQIGKTTLKVYHAFLYITLPSLHDYDEKLPNFTFCGGRELKTTLFSFLSQTSIQSFSIHLRKICLHLTN